MSDSPPNRSNPYSSSKAIFDHEKLEVYQLEVEFIKWVTVLLKEIRTQQLPLLREACDQLDRGSLSALLNTAEGNGRRATKQRARFFDDARGSATECAACLDALVAKDACSNERIAEGKGLLARIVSMLTKLVARFETGDGGKSHRVSEEPGDWGQLHKTWDEDEDEDE